MLTFSTKRQVIKSTTRNTVSCLQGVKNANIAFSEHAISHHSCQKSTARHSINVINDDDDDDDDRPIRVDICQFVTVNQLKLY